MTGLIYDCREFGEPDTIEHENATYGFNQFASGAWAALIKSPVDLGSNRMRFWDGYPTEQGATSGGYVSGTIDASRGFLLPRGGQTLLEGVPSVMIADSSTPDLGRIAAMYRAAYHDGRLLLVGGNDPSAERAFTSKHLTMRYRDSELRAANGQGGLRPNGCLPGTSDATAVVRTAAELLAGRAVPSCSAQGEVASGEGASAATPAGADALPSQGERLLALAKLWGTIRYFHPYEALNNRKWDDQLVLFVPRFAGASTRAEYEQAVMEMIARIDDTHVWMRGGKANRVSGSYTVPIYRRWLGGQLVVDQLYGDGLAGKVRPEDVITHVDGTPVGRLEESWSNLIPASSRQSRGDLVHRLVMIGAKDTSIRLTLRRGARTFDVATTRSWRGAEANDRPERNDPIWRRLRPDIGYIDLTRLTIPDSDKALDELLTTRSLILDMRGYPKGTA